MAEFIRQCFVIGYRSLPLIGLTGFIMGLVLTMQLRPSLIEYGVGSQLPAMVGRYFENKKCERPGRSTRGKYTICRSRHSK
jgi:ABC-type transporter Mla maintaining outer membrane lipid asymmetry permease subunit MlaE